MNCPYCNDELSLTYSLVQSAICSNCGIKWGPDGLFFWKGKIENNGDGKSLWIKIQGCLVVKEIE